MKEPTWQNAYRLNLGRAGQENIWPSVLAHVYAMTTVRPSHSVNKHIIYTRDKITVAMVTYENRAFRKMISYFIGVYIINRVLHGSLEILSFSSRVEWAQRTSEVFFNTRREISYLRAAMQYPLCVNFAKKDFNGVLSIV